MIGETLAHYRITAALGAGGMGEVYRATDTTLGREVAIKILPADVAQDAERLGRFRREAHLLAALNHPHVAAIHGLEEADGRPFLVLELVEGEDLRERLSRGPVPVGEALEIARQIAEALEEAHEKGIVHRDLKPANVKLTPEGRIKVLDFGLAKAWAGEAAEGSSASMSESPTLAHSGTQAGVILGTAGYMSPEQARGKAVDRRSDVWSFGVLLWEMLTGRALFTGETVTDVIAAVVREEPDLEALPAGTPRPVRRLVARCLRKDPRRRLPDIGGARLELEEVLAGTAEAATLTSPRRSAWVAVALVSAALAGLVGFLHLTEIPEPPLAVHLVLDTSDDVSFASFDMPAVSPDGRHVAFTGVSRDGTRQLWIRSLDAPEARPLAGTEGARMPFWSPDGRSIAFEAGRELRALSLADRIVQRICAVRGPMLGGTWSAEGTIVFSVGESSGARLFAVAAAGGGEARRLTTRDQSRQEFGHWWPWFLPDGRHFLLSVGSTAEEHAGLYVASLDAPEERRRLLPGRPRALYSSGHLLFVQDGALLAQPFEPGSLAVSGAPAHVAAGVSSYYSIPEWGWFSASPGRVLSYRRGRGSGGRQLVWLDRDGQRLATVGEPGFYDQIALSPDERRVAVEVPSAGQYDLWVMDVSRGVLSRLTSDPGNERDPVWSPDSREVAYGSFAVGGRDLGLFRQGLSGEPATPISTGSVANGEPRAMPDSWLSEGDTLIYKRLNGTTAWALGLEEGADAEVVLDLDIILDEPQVSPDGRWLAFISRDAGRWDVYVQPFRRPGDRVRVSRNGGGAPKWRADGRELFYVAYGQLMAVDVREGTSGPELGPAAALFPLSRYAAVADTYAVSADGQRFLVSEPAERDEEGRIHVIANWTSLLEPEQ